MMASNDSMTMPPLEYVGHSLEFAKEGLRPGDEVVLDGLSTASLNGQRAVVLPFTDPDVSRKGRLGVRLESGKQMAIKRGNLSKVANAASPSPEATATGSRASCDADSDDSMPPLENAAAAPSGGVGAGKKNELPALQSSAKTPAEEESDDDMPPLECNGVGSQAATVAKPVPDGDRRNWSRVDVQHEASSADDSMPPLDHFDVGAALKPSKVCGKPASVEFKVGDFVLLKGLKKKELNGEKARVLQAGSGHVQLSVKLISSREKLSLPTEHLEKVDEAGAKSTDSMPSLSYVGIEASEHSTTVGAATGGDTAASDDSTPPLDNVGTSKPTGSNAKAESDDSMPPLEFVGKESSPPVPAVKASSSTSRGTPELRVGEVVVLKGLSKTALNGRQGVVLQASASDGVRIPVKLNGSQEKVSIKRENLDKLEVNDDQSDDSMPPLDYVGNELKVGKDDDVPPLETPSFKSNAGAGGAESDDSMPPLEFDGSAPNVNAGGAPASDSDDDMPPLENAGGAQANAAAYKPVTVSSTPKPAEKGAEESDSSVPPFEHVQRVEFKVGDVVVLNGLTAKAELNGQQGVLLGASASDERLPVKLKSGLRIAIKKENLEKVTMADAGAESDDSMPPLDFVGKDSSSPSADATAPKPQDDDDDDDDMPPLDYVGSASVEKTPSSKVAGDGATNQNVAAKTQSAKVSSSVPATKKTDTGPSHTAEFKTGETVILTGLQAKKELNGQRAVLLDVTAKDERLPVKLSVSGQKLSIKRDNLQKIVTCSAESDDSMPPLDFVGSGGAASSATAVKQVETKKDDVSDDDDMPPLDYVGTEPSASSKPDSAVPASLLSTTKPDDNDASDDDDMPPLEYVGTGTGKQTSQSSRPAAAQASVPSKSPAVKLVVGDVVILRGLTKQELNGQRGVLLEVDVRDGERFPVKLNSSGQKLLIKKDNFEKKTSRRTNIEKVTSDSDDSMPPLDFVGSASPTAQSKQSGDGKQRVEDAQEAASNDSSMPPLEYTGAPQKKENDDEDDDDDMPPLEYDAAREDTTSVAGVNDSAKVELDSEDSMPPLECSGVPPTPCKETGDGQSEDSLPPLELGDSAPANAEASDDSMPPLENGAAPPSASATSKTASAAPIQKGQIGAASPAKEKQGFKAGEIVVLKDLGNDKLNGQRATVVNATSRTHADRCAVKVISSNQRLSVKYDKIEKLYQEAAVAKTSSAAPVTPGRPAADPKGALSTKQVPMPNETNSTNSSAEKRVPAAAKAKPAQPRPAVSAESLLDRMREAQLSNSEKRISDVLNEMEGLQDMNWGDLLTKKKQAMKKLRAKKRKLEVDGPQAPESEAPTAAETEPAIIHVPTRSFLKPAGLHSEMSDMDCQSVTSDMWYLLDPEKPLQEWCASLSLPPELLQRLEAEEVKSPSELAFVPEEELQELVKGVKLGPKGRFLAAVQYLRRKK